MAEIKIGRVRLAFKGPWDNQQSYQAQETVTYQGSSYAAKLDVPAGIAPTNTTYWQVVAERGTDGQDGTDGAQGPAGPQGPEGPQGPQGLQGPEGPQGSTGPEGPAGPEGPEGPEGPMGPVPQTQWDGTSLSFEKPDGTFTAPVDLQGPAGPKGDKGGDGLQGPQGPAGPEGPTGPQGDPGAQGPAGPKGDKGDPPNHTWDGTSLRFQNPDGSYGSFVDLQGPQGPPGTWPSANMATVYDSGEMGLRNFTQTPNGWFDRKYEYSIIAHGLSTSSNKSITMVMVYTDGTFDNVAFMPLVDSELNGMNFQLQFPVLHGQRAFWVDAKIWANGKANAGTNARLPSNKIGNEFDAGGFWVDTNYKTLQRLEIKADGGENFISGAILAFKH